MHVSTMRPDDADMATWLANSFTSPRKRHDAITAIRERFASSQTRFAIYDARPEQGGRLIGIILIDATNTVSDVLSEYDMGRVLGAISQRYGTAIGTRGTYPAMSHGMQGQPSRPPMAPHEVKGGNGSQVRANARPHPSRPRRVESTVRYQGIEGNAAPIREELPEQGDGIVPSRNEEAPGIPQQGRHNRQPGRQVRRQGAVNQPKRIAVRPQDTSASAQAESDAETPHEAAAIAPSPLTVAYDPKGKAARNGTEQISSPIPAGASRNKAKERPRHRVRHAIVSVIVAILAITVIASVSAVAMAFVSPSTLSGIPGGTRLLGVLGIDTTDLGGSNGNHTQIGEDEKATIAVPSGATAMQVRQLLYDAGLANAGDSILQTLEEKNQLANIQPGTYEFLGSEDADTIINRLVNGQRYPSGYLGVDKGNTLAYIESKVDSGSGFAFSGSDLKAAEDPNLYKSEFTMLSAVPDDLHTVEGFIPEGIYNLTKATDGKSAMEIMLQAGQERFERSGMSAEDWYKNLTIAAMIDKEVFYDDEKPLVSSVIHNRLNQNMKLGIDATVKYATGKDDARVLNTDLEIDSKYNTYKYTGLPLGPICSGISDSAIDAAQNPKQTDYVYYVLKDKEGHHFFTNNVQDFENAKQEYLKLFGYSN